jgi:hypothetical protein
MDVVDISERSIKIVVNNKVYLCPRYCRSYGEIGDGWTLARGMKFGFGEMGYVPGGVAQILVNYFLVLSEVL